MVTEDSAEKEVYQIADTFGSHYYGDVTKGDSQLLGEVYGTSLVPLRASTDPVYPIFLYDPFPVSNFGMQIKAGKEGVVMLQKRAPGSGYSTNTPINQVDIYEASHRPWEEIGVTNKTSLLSPKELPNAQPNASFSVASDGSVYVADFVSYDDKNCYESACPSYAVLTKFVAGQVVWQDYWETALPVLFRDITANKDGVSILLSQYDLSKPLPGALDPDNIIANFSTNGELKGNFVIPSNKITKERVSGPILTHMETNDAGKLIIYNDSGILSGDLTNGFARSFIYDTSGTKRIEKVILKNNYVYAIGADKDNDLKRHVLPFDADLNPR
ncbi:hypothetical protein Q0M94_20545 (plasmid) [Deinococcus radiomollis]|uniref:hypothetical protein n=1 Tax=Deinococcus radiomollis TaxID=468916 RepID=UPI00389186FC